MSPIEKKVTEMGNDDVQKSNNNNNNNNAIKADTVITNEKLAYNEEPYDPHLHRSVPKPTSNYETLLHLVKAATSTGILAVPKAFEYSGLVMGIFGTIIVCGICTYCLHLLVKAQYELCKRFKVPLLTYRDSMKKALQVGPEWLRPLAKHSGVITDVLIVLELLGSCCVSVLFVGSNLKAVFDIYVTKLDIRIHLLIIMLPVILLSYVRDLKRLAPLSLIGNILSFIALVIILYFTCKDELSFDGADLVGELWNMPLFVGTMLFAVDTIGVTIACENNMKTPQSFGGYFGVLNQGMLTITAIYIVLGFFGYLRYKSDTEDSITLNLGGDGLAVAVQMILSAAALVSFMLVFYGPIEIIWNNYMKVKLLKKEKPRLFFWEYLLRTCLALVAVGLVIALPNLGDFISLLGAVTIALLGIAFPAIIDTCVRWPHQLGRFNWILIKNILLTIFSVLSFLAGTYVSLDSIIRKAQNDLDHDYNSTVVEGHDKYKYAIGV